MNVTNILKGLQQAGKVLKAVRDLADTAAHIKKMVAPSLPQLKIPPLRRGSPDKDEVKKLYDELVEELKTERAAHEQTRQYLRWATKEIENVKEAMRDWQKKALEKRRSGRGHRRRGN